MDRITKEEMRAYLEEIFACEVFEFHQVSDEEGKQSFYIPYMMNDALECYLMLADGHMTGEYRAELKEPMSADFVETDEGPAIIFRQGIGNVFTVWYQNCYRILECYRYDQIGHFWVEGEEHWRRLVYIVGTIHDKFNYMGETVCNALELELMPLMEFAPFRFFSPIHDSLDDEYEESTEGLETMKKYACEAGDRSFLRLLKLYEVVPFKRQCMGFLVQAMKKQKRTRLYQLIFEKVHQASVSYPERMYPESVEKEISDARNNCAETMKRCGFSGTYPLFYKDGVQILAMEEHPFTILEWDQYKFKIQYMVSEGTGITTQINEGFFKDKGNRGWIARNLDFLENKLETMI